MFSERREGRYSRAHIALVCEEAPGRRLVAARGLQAFRRDLQVAVVRARDLRGRSSNATSLAKHSEKKEMMSHRKPPTTRHKHKRQQNNCVRK